MSNRALIDRHAYNPRIALTFSFAASTSSCGLGSLISNHEERCSVAARLAAPSPGTGRNRAMWRKEDRPKRAVWVKLRAQCRVMQHGCENQIFSVVSHLQDDVMPQDA